jgi:hypothetical protein
MVEFAERAVDACGGRRIAEKFVVELEARFYRGKGGPNV